MTVEVMVSTLTDKESEFYVELLQLTADNQQNSLSHSKFLEFMSGLGLKDLLTFDGWMSFLDS